MLLLTLRGCVIQHWSPCGDMIFNNWYDVVTHTVKLAQEFCDICEIGTQASDAIKGSREVTTN